MYLFQANYTYTSFLTEHSNYMSRRYYYSHLNLEHMKFTEYHKLLESIDFKNDFKSVAAAMDAEVDSSK